METEETMQNIRDLINTVAWKEVAILYPFWNDNKYLKMIINQKVNDKYERRIVYFMDRMSGNANRLSEHIKIVKRIDLNSLSRGQQNIKALMKDFYEKLEEIEAINPIFMSTFKLKYMTYMIYIVEYHDQLLKYAPSNNQCMIGNIEYNNAAIKKLSDNSKREIFFKFIEGQIAKKGEEKYWKVINLCLISEKSGDILIADVSMYDTDDKKDKRHPEEDYSIISSFERMNNIDEAVSINYSTKKFFYYPAEIIRYLFTDVSEYIFLLAVDALKNGIDNDHAEKMIMDKIQLARVYYTDNSSIKISEFIAVVPKTVFDYVDRYQYVNKLKNKEDENDYYATAKIKQIPVGVIIENTRTSKIYDDSVQGQQESLNGIKIGEKLSVRKYVDGQKKNGEYIMRILVNRYQFELLSNSKKIAKNVIDQQYGFFNNLLNYHIKKAYYIIQSCISVSGTFSKESFLRLFLKLTTDFDFEKNVLDQKSAYVVRKNIELVDGFITGVMQDSNIRNRLFMLLNFSKIIHYTLIRKLFMVQYLINQIEKKATNLDSDSIINNYFDICLRHGIDFQDSIITFDDFTQKYEKIDRKEIGKIIELFDIQNCCRSYNINYKILLRRYLIMEELIVLKSDDTGTDNLGVYLFDVLDKNQTKSFMLYMFEDYKYGTYGRIRLPRKTNAPIYNDNDIYPPIDDFEFKEYDKINHVNRFSDRGIDTQRFSVYDKDNIFREAYGKGEPLLTGVSGHTADLLILIGLLNNEIEDDVDHAEKMLRVIKCFTLLCIAAMFTRKDHSIFEIYRSISLFKTMYEGNKGDIFKCPENKYINGECLEWLYSDIEGFSYKGFSINEKKIKSVMRSNLTPTNYLSNAYADAVREIVGVLDKGDNTTFGKLCEQIVSIMRAYVGSLKLDKEKIIDNDVYKELFFLFLVMRYEYLKKDLNDVDYIRWMNHINILEKKYRESGIIPYELEKYNYYRYEDNVNVYNLYRSDVMPMNTKENLIKMLINYFCKQALLEKK
jgi:hypothetical protein